VGGVAGEGLGDVELLEVTDQRDEEERGEDGGDDEEEGRGLHARALGGRRPVRLLLRTPAGRRGVNRWKAGELSDGGAQTQEARRWR
jgi:hypothetical protein